MRSIRSNPSSVAPPVGTYSHAAVVEAGEVRWLFVSGQLALDGDGVLVGAGDMAAQTEQVFENLVHILEAHGATFEDVVKVQTFVTTLEGFPEVREVRARYLPEEPPASTAGHARGDDRGGRRRGPPHRHMRSRKGARR